MKKLDAASLEKIEKLHSKCSQQCSCKLLLGHVEFLTAMVQICMLAEKSRARDRNG